MWLIHVFPNAKQQIFTFIFLSRHYMAQVEYGFFGSRYQDSYPLKNFPLHNVTVPLSLHHSNVDTFADPQDVKKLVPLLVNSKKLHVQTITQLFNHMGRYC